MTNPFFKNTGPYDINYLLKVIDLKDNNFNKDETTILDDEEHYKDDNLNYLININA